MTAQQLKKSVSQPCIRLMIIARHRLDGEALTVLLDTCEDFQVDELVLGAEEATAVYARCRPHVALLDGALVGREVNFDAAAFLEVEEVGPVLVLDADVHHRRLTMTLKTHSVGYFTRHAGFDELAEGLRRLAAGERAFEALVSEGLKELSQGRRSASKQHGTGLASLTPRQLQVLRLIALGNSVPECAEILQLAESTVDNHKARLMKKLGVHRVAELARLAIREGLVHP